MKSWLRRGRLILVTPVSLSNQDYSLYDEGKKNAKDSGYRGNKQASILKDHCGLVWSRAPRTASTLVQSRVVSHMRLRLSGRWPRRAGREGVSPIRTKSRGRIGAQPTRYNAPATVHASDTTLKFFLRFLSSTHRFSPARKAATIVAVTYGVHSGEKQ